MLSAMHAHDVIRRPEQKDQTFGNGRPARQSEIFADRFLFYIYAPSSRSSAERKTYR